ncbi:RadC family protein [Anaerobacillus isosaccharinicus]|uniref:DNA repair protein RadC n=1 Tax=Anaerobacillus isosaccharinicus TaxID=1532552 RepID=A0A1S2L119_9BACI|nr:DNA repair protein RadC [Anaerobacillus isosaccharinicus]MBA5588927.1 DNA repair protein RadC [Anaerobacillus isosaccharinicus]QOY37662.1 DNA repair protein RadC [Anaerobacillus isosaccharinicus]
MQTSLFNKNISEKSYTEIVREKIAFYGTEYASINDLLAIIIGKDNPILCSQIASLSVRELMDMTISDFMEFDGIGKRTAEQLVASIALAKKLANESLPSMHTARNPEDTAKIFDDLRHNQQEHFVVAYLDTKLHVIGKKTISIGLIDAALVHPREVYKDAIKRSAATIICAHSHPSGDPNPSKEDLEITKRLKKAGELIGIKLLDHVIIGDGRWVSLKDMGYI